MGVGVGVGVGAGAGPGAGAGVPPLGAGAEPPEVPEEPEPPPLRPCLRPPLGVVVAGTPAGTLGTVGSNVWGDWLVSDPPLDAIAITTIRKNSATAPSAT
ncbi:MAG: hypothetical protein QOG63_1460 [Thermoleophilaceae bacterium]|nr:hypothetical protein [Thermoleophilaceae bacterium]